MFSRPVLIIAFLLAYFTFLTETALAGFLGIEVEERDGGLYIVKIVEGSPAALLNLPSDARIKSFNGIEITRRGR